MNDEQQASLLVRILSLVFFILLTLGAFTWFAISAVGLISDLRMESPVIGFDKGSMYTLGCGLGLLSITIGGVLQGILKLDLTPKQISLFSRSIVASLILMIIVPQMAHYAVHKFAKNKNYSICENASYRWLIYTKIYYTKNIEACDELVKIKELKRSSSGR